MPIAIKKVYLCESVQRNNICNQEVVKHTSIHTHMWLGLEKMSWTDGDPRLACVPRAGVAGGPNGVKSAHFPASSSSLDLTNHGRKWLLL